MLAIRCGRVFDGERFRPGPATVLVDGPRLAGIEPGHPEVGDHWQVIECGDSTVLPGLIDTHVHLIADSRFGALDRVPGYSDGELSDVISSGLRRQLAAGVTTVRDLGDRRFAVVDRRDRQRSGDGTSLESTIVASGPPLTSPRGHCHYLGGEVAGRDAMAAEIKQRVDRRVDVVKVMASGGMTTAGTDVLHPQFSDEDLRFIVDLAHEAGLPVTAHAHGLPAVEQAIAARVDGIEHCTCLTESGFAQSDELVSRIAEAGIAVSGIIPLPAIVAEPVPPPLLLIAKLMGVPPDRIREVRAGMVRQLHQGGVRVVTGIDAGLNPWLAHGNLFNSIRFLADAGFTAAEVLAAATSQAAIVCGLGAHKGRIVSGYDADLIVVEGDPEHDLDGVNRVRRIVLAGTMLDPDDYRT